MGGSDALMIGTYPDAQQSKDWPTIEALLRPAADRGGIDIEQGPAWTVWTVHRNGELIAAANVRRTVDREAEVTLIGGKGFREWLKPLDEMIGLWASEERCTKLVACGRLGWSKHLGWDITAAQGNFAAYERSLVA